MSFTRYKRRGSPHWQIAITVPGRKRIRRSSRTPDKKRANALAEAIEAKEWDRRTTGDESALTFAEAVMLYRRDGGSAQYLAPLVKHFKDRSVTGILAADIKAAASELYPKATAATWNRQVVTPARFVINHAADRGLASHIKVKKFLELRPVRKAPVADWLPAFLDHAPPRMAALALLMRVTAARIGQAIDLDWNAVNLTEAIAIIPSAKNHADRKAFLTPECVAALANIDGERKGLVFGFRSRRRVYDAWYAVCDAAGIARVGTHDAGRRAFATSMAHAGVDPKTAADMGGWKSVRIMLEIYTDSAASREVLNRVFSGTTASQSVVRNHRTTGKNARSSK